MPGRQRSSENNLAKLPQIFRSLHGTSDGPGIPGYFAAVLGGALLGGIALALLNRKTIQELRDKLEQPPPYPDDVY